MSSAAPKQAEVFLQTPGFEDVETIQRWYKEPELREYFRRYPPLVEWRRPEQTLQGLGAAFCVYEGNTLVGLCQIVNYDPSSKSVEVGMLVDKTKASNRHNVSFKAYKQLCDYLFNSQGYQKLAMRVLTHRTKLVKRLCDVGWRVEGELRKSTSLDGKPANEFYLGLLKEDYK